MEHFLSFLFVVSVTRIWVHSVSCLDAEKRFIVVSGYKQSGLSYPDIQPTKPDSQPVLSKRMKKQICEDVLSSYCFRQRKEIPLDDSHPPWLDWLTKDARPNKTVKVKLNFEGDEYDEKGFVCTSIYNNFSELKYIISDEYNLNAVQPDDLSHIPMLARFIFFERGDDWFIYGVAELRGEAYRSPDQDIERIYLQRRESQNQKEDILCRLAEQNTRRICLAVFNSKYFENKVLLQHAGKVTTDCVEQSVSFQTETQATGRFKEWMLNCKKSTANRDGVQFNYLLSYAYESNQIFVYFRRTESGEVFPENLTTNVRLRPQPTIIEFKQPERVKNDD